MAQCSRCGRTGGMFDVKLYNLPNKQDKILCNACYQEIIRSGEYHNQSGQQPQISCPGCNRPVNSDFKICPYCGIQIAGRIQTQNVPAKKDIHCPSCGGKITSEYKVCPFCGKKIEEKIKKETKSNYCAQCGAELNPGQKFCANCGKKAE